MILITGGTGFVGQILVQHLVEAGYQVRMLIRPSKKTPRLPHGVPVEVAVASLHDERGLRAAMLGVDAVYHLAGGEKRGAYASLLEDDILGTQAAVQAAVAGRVKRFFYLSHLGVERASAYPVFKAKAIAEEYIRRSGIDYTIFRSAVLFGPGDGFTTRFAGLARYLPFFFPLPGDGNTRLQPLWVHDLATCLVWALEDEKTLNNTYEVGGGEFFSFSEIINIICSVIGIRRRLVPIYAPYLRALVVFLESYIPAFPISIFWLDYLAVNRTCSVDTLPRSFNLIPARFTHNLEYLKIPPRRRKLSPRSEKPA